MMYHQDICTCEAAAQNLPHTSHVMNAPFHFDSKAPARFVSPGFIRALLVLSPVCVASATAGAMEWGLLLLPSASAARLEIELPLAWLIQVLVGGNLVVVCFFVWLHTLLRAHWPADELLRMNAGLCASWVQVGWVSYAIMRLGSLGADDAAVPVLFMALPMLGIVGLLLWNAARRLARPAQSAWVLGGFLVPAIALLLLSVNRLAAEPEIIFTIESSVIAIAIAVWLAVYGVTSARPIRRQAS